MKRWFFGFVAIALAFLMLEPFQPVDRTFALGSLLGYLVSGIWFEWISPKR